MRVGVLIGVALALSASCFAAPIVFSGVDVGTGNGPFPNSLAARLAFLAAIGGSPTQSTDFESTSTGFVSPQTFGIATFTCTGCLTTTASAAGVQIVDVLPSEDGFDTTAQSPTGHFYRSAASGFGGSNTLTITFANPVFAFGAYFAGVETFYGTTTVTFTGDGPPSFVLSDTGNNTANGPAGVQFYGFTSSIGVSSITFSTVNVATRRDLFSIDDLVLVATPEPAAIGLTAAGMAALLIMRRRSCKRS